MWYIPDTNGLLVLVLLVLKLSAETIMRFLYKAGYVLYTPIIHDIELTWSRGPVLAEIYPFSSRLATPSMLNWDNLNPKKLNLNIQIKSEIPFPFPFGTATAWKFLFTKVTGKCEIPDATSSFCSFSTNWSLYHVLSEDTNQSLMKHPNKAPQSSQGQDSQYAGKEPYHCRVK